MGIMQLKGKNVTKILLFCLLVFFYSNNCFAQKKIEGSFILDYSLKDFSTNLVFYPNGIFEYNHSGDLGLLEFGKGEYFIRKDSLMLKYNLTKLRENSYFKTKTYFNNKDSISVKFNIYDFSKQSLNRIQIWSFPNYKDTETNKEGEAFLNFKKKSFKEVAQIHIDQVGFDKLIVYINLDRNYEIDVFLNKTETYEYHPKALKNQVEKFKILEITDKNINLKKQDKIIRLMKINNKP
ncbi:hypothetical protein [Tenacibaculum xiamenense]|uniref:hypothetical protein n=1 Tax=Tenacibaculum xiamenense TaxID=1261553 RepID=UPI003893FFBD